MGAIQGNDEKMFAPCIRKWLIAHTFYNGLLYTTRMTLDVAAGETFMYKPYGGTYVLIEDMKLNHY